MTRTLGKQVNDPRTKFNRLSLNVDPGQFSSTITNSTINAKATSDAPGGSDQKTLPRILGTAVEPFAISSGSIGIRIDGGSTTVVTLLSSDNTASRIARKINIATPGNDIAFYVNGQLLLKSNGTSGPTGTMELTNTSGTILNTLGIPTGVITGIGDNIRGVITNSVSDNGGYVQIHGTGGQLLVTNAADFILSNESGGDFSYNPLVMGGLPVYGRMSHNGTAYILKYFTAIPTNAEINTQAADFSSISSADVVSVEITQNGATKTFGFAFDSGVNTQDTIIDKFNDQWAVEIGAPDSKVHVIGNVSQPYSFDNESIQIAVNGGSFVNVNLQSPDTNAVDVCAKLNAVPGLFAEPITHVNGIYIHITTVDGVGYKSSLEFKTSTGQRIQNGLSKIGVAQGKYVGPHVAKPRGLFEMTLFAQNRGGRSGIQISCNGVLATATRLGLFTETTNVVPNSDAIEVAVPTPSLTFPGKEFVNTDTEDNTYRIELAFPEVVSFGELPTNYTTENAEFDTLATGANNDSRNDYGQFNLFQAFPTFGNNLKNAGQVVSLGPDGFIDLGQLRHATDLMYRYVKQFVRGSHNSYTVTGLFSNRITTTGSDDNPRDPSATMLLEVDPDESFTDDDRSVSIQMGSSTTARYKFQHSLFTARGGLDLGLSLIGNSTDSSTLSRVKYNLLNSGSFSRNLISVSESNSANNGKVRIYVATLADKTSSYEVTQNANWDGTNWVKDTTSKAACIFEAGSFDTGVRYRVESSGSATVADAAFLDNFIFPKVPDVGNENQFGTLLRLGQTYINQDTAASANIPRINTDFNFNTSKRVVLWEMNQNGGTGSKLRLYSCSRTFHGNGNRPGIELTQNARWDNATNLWNRDVASHQASKMFLGEHGFHVKTTQNTVPATWADDDTAAGWRPVNTGASNEDPSTSLAWNSISTLSGAKKFEVFYPGPIQLSNNIFNDNTIKNALHANLVPKIYGQLIINSGAAASFEGVNVPAPTIFGPVCSISYVHAPFSSFNVVVTTCDHDTGQGPLAIMVIPSPTTIQFVLKNSATGAQVNFGTIASVRWSFVVFYEAL